MDIETDVDYCSKLRAERKKRSWTQKEVAAVIGISRSYYNDIENGRVLPSGKVFFKINRILPIFFTTNDVNSDDFGGGY